MARPFERDYAVLILNLLVEPFEKTKAFQQGMIDSEGNLLKQPVTQADADSYTPLHKVVFGLKKIINKFPSEVTRVKQLATSLNWLRRLPLAAAFQEDYQEPDYNQFLKEFLLVIDNDLILAEEETIVEKFLSEEGEGSTSAGVAPANSTDNIDIHTPVIDKLFRKKKKEGDE